jgi:DNA repair exonuclease SbcCD ATPase subunit
VWLALYPLVSGGPGRAEPSAELRELEAEKDRLVQDLHELELDRATGKLSEEDWRELDARLKGRAVETIKEIDARTASGSPPP